MTSVRFLPASLPPPAHGDSDNSTARVILLVAIVLLAGVLTTSVIVRRYEASLPVSEEIRRGTRDLEYR